MTSGFYTTTDRKTQRLGHLDGLQRPLTESSRYEVYGVLIDPT